MKSLNIIFERVRVALKVLCGQSIMYRVDVKAGKVSAIDDGRLLVHTCRFDTAFTEVMGELS